ncbi:MAG TPA: guanine permease, partial [Gammaproteobacteria bacterium]|nr:guanine permease [Gammaproteobacteria bacterium]
GLTAIVIGLFFLVCLFFAPLAESVPAYATAAALLFVATTMVSSLAQVQWTDITEAAPAAITAIAMPLAFSIADGIGIGFIAYAAIKALSGRWRETPVAVHVTAVIFALKFALA